MLTTIVQNIIAGQPGTFSIAVKDLSMDKQFSYNSHPMRAASMIKIFMMVEAFRQKKAGLLDFQEVITITNEMRTPGAGQLYDAPPGTTRTILELIEVMITESDNTATNIMIDKLGMKNINRLLADMHFSDTIIKRKMMDWESAKAGLENLTSVDDVNTILEQIHYRRCLNESSDQAMLDILLKQTDKSKIPLMLPPGIAIAHKTGELKGAEHDGGIVYAARPYIISIMSDGLPDADKGKELIARLSRAIYDYLLNA